MEGGRWTDERLDDLAAEVHRGFERIDRDMRDLRTDLTVQMEALRQTMLRGGAALLASQMIGFLGVIATILARGS